VSGPKPDLYVCGEETALIEFLENRRGEPQLKPPYPFQSGYRGQPTVIQNVETLAWIPLVMANPRLFAEQGYIKLVHLFGAVHKPGIYEVRIGSSLRDLLETAGGLNDGSSVQAIEVGGVAGGLLPPDRMALPLEHEVMTHWGAMVGTGSVRFLDRNTNLVEEALHAMEFFRDESCGRCTPCRVGTQELVRIAESMTKGSANDEELEWFDDLAQTMTNTSTCGLGKGAPTMLLSLLRYWNIENGQAQLKENNVIDAYQQVLREAQMA
jgi:NADH:ubiquinone oxidoreductase subunit F (NADH-binding)